MQKKYQTTFDLERLFAYLRPRYAIIRFTVRQPGHYLLFLSSMRRLSSGLGTLSEPSQVCNGEMAQGMKYLVAQFPNIW
jgi:hypothetical protein